MIYPIPVLPIFSAMLLTISMQAQTLVLKTTYAADCKSCVEVKNVNDLKSFDQLIRMPEKSSFKSLHFTYSGPQTVEVDVDATTKEAYFKKFVPMFADGVKFVLGDIKATAADGSEIKLGNITYVLTAIK